MKRNISKYYKGFQTYQESDAAIFNGRSDDTEKLFERIVNNDITVLYANSGIGKSSVINAGLCPLLKLNRYFPIYVRCGEKYNVNSFDSLFIELFESPQKLASAFGNSERPILLGSPNKRNRKKDSRSTQENIDSTLKFRIVSIIDTASDAVLQEMDEILSKKSLWWYLRTRQIKCEIFPGYEIQYLPLLVFDQFEEFFDHASDFDQTGKVFRWYNQLFSKLFPEDIQKLYNKLSKKRGEAPLFKFPLECKALLSMRREYIGQLDYWAYQNEDTRNTSFVFNRYFLRPLQKSQALEVISLSEKVQQNKDVILEFIGANEKDGYPAILLSVICKELDEDNDELLKNSNVSSLLQDAYNETLKRETTLTNDQIEKVEELLVDNVSSKRKRCSKIDLLEFIRQKDVDDLLDCHVITRVGDYYELIHDRLVEIVADKTKHAKKRTENALIRKSELNVLTENGRRLMDNAIDFGEYRTLKNRPGQYPLDSLVASAPLLKIQKNLRIQNSREVDKFYLKGVLDDEKTDDAYSHLYFSDSAGDRVCTNDGIYHYKIKYNGDRIEDVRFFGKTDDDYIYVYGGYHGVKIELENLLADGSFVEKRTYLNHEGEAVENMDGYAIMRIYFNIHGLIEKVRYYNIFDKPCLHANGNHGFDSEFNEDGFEISRFFVDVDGNPIKITSGVYGRKFRYDTRGLLSMEINIDDKGKNMIDYDGYCIVKYKYDSEGRIIKESYYDLEEKLCLGHRGYAVVVAEYGDKDSTESYFDVEGHNVQDKDGYYFEYKTYDKYDRIIAVRYKNENNSLTLDKDGSSGFSITYDERGRLSSFITYGENDRQRNAIWLEYTQDGTHIAKAGSLNPDGQRTKISDYDCYALSIVKCGLQYPVLIFLDNEGRPQKCNDGYWAVMKEANSEGDTIRETYYDQNYRPMKSIEGYYGKEVEYDYIRNTQRITFIYGESNEMSNVHSMLIHLDKYGETEKLLYYDNNNKITKCADGTCGYSVRYSDDMTIKKVVNLDENEKPIDDNEGVSCSIEERILISNEWHIAKQYCINCNNEVVPDSLGDYFTLFEYTDDGREVKIISADKLGRPRNNNNGYAILLKKFDKRNNIIEYSYLDENELLCINKEEGIAGKETIYDNQDRLISFMSYDEKRNPIKNKDNGAYIIKIEYESNKIGISYLDKNGCPMKSNSGYEVLEKVLDEKGEPIEDHYYDHNHLPMRDNNGDYGKTQEYEKINGETIKRICYLGEDGKPHINKDGYAFKETCTDEQERLIYEKYYDETMHPMCVWENDTYMVEYEYNDENNEIIRKYLRPNGTLGKGDNNISIHCIYRDEKGRTVKELFFDSNNNPLFIDSFCGISVEYDDENLSELITLLDENGNPCDNSEGYCKQLIYKDENGNTIKEMRYDANGKPVVDSDGDTAKAYIYEYGNPNVQTIVSLDAEGKPHINNKGWALQTIVIDESGRTCFKMQYDVNSKPLPNANGDCGVMRQYSDQDDECLETFLDAEGNPHMGTRGYSSCHIEKNRFGKIIREMFFDINGNPAYDSLGDSGTGYIYDDENPQVVTVVSLDEEGNPRMNNKGWTYKKQLADDKNRIVIYLLYDDNNQPVSDDSGIFGAQYDYIEDGGSYYVSYLNESKELQADIHGIARRLVIKDDMGRTILQMDYDVNGNPVFDDLGDAGTAFEYEPDSYLPSRIISVDEKEQPRINIYGYSVRQLEYDEDGHIKEEFFYDTKGKPTTDNHGCYGARYKYDDNKKESMTICLDKEGNPFVTDDGFAAISRVRDEDGRVLLEKWYDENLEPVANELGDYGVVIEYCKDGGRITTSIGSDMKPRINNRGYAKRYTRYDENSRIVEERWFDVDMNPISDSLGDYGTGYIYGIENNDITFISLDIDGKPRINSKGWAFNRRKTDERGRTILDITYDVNKHPIENKFGDFGTITEYFDKENKIIEISLGENLKPHINNYGYTKKVIILDKSGSRVKKERTFTIDDIPAPNQWGDCGTDYVYDDQLNAVTQISLDENEMPRINIKGWAIETKSYDEKGRVISRQQFDTEHHLIPNSNGCCGEIIEYDDVNHSHSISYIGIDGTIWENSWGMAIICCTDDSYKRPIKYEFFDKQKNPIHDENGNFGIGFQYDEDAQVRILICLDKNGKPHECVKGYAYRKELLNENHDVVRYYLYNIDKEPLANYECRISYCYDEDQTEIRTYYDINGNKCVIGNGYFKVISFTDNQGNRISLYFDTEGSLVSQ